MATPRAGKRAGSKKRAAPRKSTTRKATRSKAERTLTVVQVHSGIGCTERQRAVLRSLGLRGPLDRHSLPDAPSVRGMVAAVSHLVCIEEPAGGSRAGRRRA